MSEDEPFVFTAWSRPQEVELRLTRRLRRGVELQVQRRTGQMQGSLQQRLTPLTLHQSEFSLSGQQGTLELHVTQEAYQLSIESPVLTAWLIRVLRQRGMVSTQRICRLAQHWGLSGQEAVQTLVHEPSVFASPAEGTWTLTPWVKRRASFTPRYLTIRSPALYEEDATQFWLEERHVPSEEEEWNQKVREKVAAYIHVAPVPAYFRQSRFGPFVQEGAGIPSRRLSLVVSELPEGPYFKIRMPDGEHLYSVTGQALFVDTSQSVFVASHLAEVRFRELLESQTRCTPLEQGKAFIAACRAARIRAYG